MAEVFGVISGSVGIATAFSACVDCFEYIQISRHFGTDFETKSLTISLLRLRLSRWGEAVDIYGDQQLGDPDAASANLEVARKTVFQILGLLEDSRRVSERYKLPDVSSTASKNEDNSTLAKVENKMRNIVVHRQKQASVLKLAAWAIYDKKNFSRLVEDISELLDLSENTFPAPQRRFLLAKEEVRQIKSEVDGAQAAEIFDLLKDLSGRVDQVLENEMKVGSEAIGHRVDRAYLGDEYDASFGHQIDSAWKGVEMLPQGGGYSSVGFLKTGKRGKLLVGNRYN